MSSKLNLQCSDGKEQWTCDVWIVQSTKHKHSLPPQFDQTEHNQTRTMSMMTEPAFGNCHNFFGQRLPLSLSRPVLLLKSEFLKLFNIVANPLQPLGHYPSLSTTKNVKDLNLASLSFISLLTVFMQTYFQLNWTKNKRTEIMLEQVLVVFLEQKTLRCVSTRAD